MDEHNQAEKIQRRHDAFVAQYSPGPDWEPCNQMSLDRGWLLTRLREVEGERDKLKNDLLDALDLKAGNGPTALSMLADAKAHAEQRVVGLEAALIQIADTQPNNDPVVWAIVMAANAALTEQ